jgi:hypothetical protein
LNPLHPTPTGDAWAGGLKKRFPFSLNAETLDETTNTGSNHPKMNGKTPFLPLNPLHPTPTGDAWAGGLKKRFPFSN